MQAYRRHHRYSYADYLRFEEDANTRHEYFDGAIYAMAGGSREHAALAANLIGEMTVQLRDRPCQPHSSDLRVRVQATGLATYADVTVIWGHVELDPEDTKRHTVTNPIVLCEVLSPSTEDYDRGEKLEHYKKIPSVRHVVHVAYAERSIEVWTRDESAGWNLESPGAGGRVRLSGIVVELDVDRLYRDPLNASRDLTRAAS